MEKLEKTEKQNSEKNNDLVVCSDPQEATIEEKKTELTDSQVLNCLEEPSISAQKEAGYPINTKIKALQSIFSRSLALLMISLILSTGIMISTIAVTFISLEHYVVLWLFKAFCIISSIFLMIISICLTFKISGPRYQGTLREF